MAAVVRTTTGYQGIESMMEHSPRDVTGRNRLQYEKSPYLLQHAANPVDWYPWGDEAFAKAKTEDKPIFLSIGYSTCHWCHVMERESFEDADVAGMMNDTFVNIKVDREERPDIDNLYMTVCQMMTRGGGWPLTIIMTPDRKPFFAGTYFPKESLPGRVGMLELVPRVKYLWQAERAKIDRSADELTAMLAGLSSQVPGQELGTAVLDAARSQLAGRYDTEFGGFGDRPKFPTPHTLLFLLRRYKASGDLQSLHMVEKTLDGMRRGGMYDQIGFGFHRYSTDREALLALAYIETYQVTGDDKYARTAQEIFTYVLRDMTSPEGGFYSAEDADSEGEEGKFYLWNEGEIIDSLGPDDAKLFSEAFSIQADGNFADEASGRKTGLNIPHLERSIAELASSCGMPENELSMRLEKLRQKLYKIREARVRPHKDDKILTEWNSLMIAALAKGAQVFDRVEYAQAAQRAVDFLWSTMRTPDGKLLHRYRDGEAAIHGNCDDYAFLIWGLLELYEATFNVEYLEHALALNDTLLKEFWDEQTGGFYFSPAEAGDLIVRQKEISDGALPSGNSVAMLNLLRLARITANPRFETNAHRIGRAFFRQVSQMPTAHTMLLTAVEFASGISHEVVVVGDPDANDTKDMLDALRRMFLPNTIVLFHSNDEQKSRLAAIAEFAADLKGINNRATAYVCRNYACELPTSDIQKMLELLAG
jgi:uncharacterized protein YyaL (SSP411 family)